MRDRREEKKGGHCGAAILQEKNYAAQAPSQHEGERKRCRAIWKRGRGKKDSTKYTNPKEKGRQSANQRGKEQSRGRTPRQRARRRKSFPKEKKKTEDSPRATAQKKEFVSSKGKGELKGNLKLQTQKKGTTKGYKTTPEGTRRDDLPKKSAFEPGLDYGSLGTIWSCPKMGRNTG